MCHKFDVRHASFVAILIAGFNWFSTESAAPQISCPPGQTDKMKDFKGKCVPEGAHARCGRDEVKGPEGWCVAKASTCPPGPPS